MRQTLAFVPDSEENRLGWLCVRHADSYSDKPELTVLYWPIVRGHVRDFRETFPELDSDTELCDGGNGLYNFYRGSGSYSPTLRLQDGGSTKPVKTETIPIPCPKVRKGIETRFYRGAWEKYGNYIPDSLK